MSYQSPTTTVPHLFFPDTDMVSTGDKTQVNLTQLSSGVGTAVIRTKFADTMAEVSQARVCTGVYFPFSGRLFLCLPPVGARISATTSVVRNNASAHEGESTSRLHRVETSNTHRALLVLVALWPQINRKLLSCPLNLPSFGFAEFQMWATADVKV